MFTTPPPSKAVSVTADNINENENPLTDNLTVPSTSTPNPNIQPVLSIPTGKLGAITRKQNEIEELLKCPTIDAKLLEEQFQIYSDRVDNLFTACELELSKPNLKPTDCNELIEWKSRVSRDIFAFREKFTIIYKKLIKLQKKV
jgi:hypothetical protein